MLGTQTTHVRHIFQGLASLIIIITGIKLGSTLVIPLLLSALLALVANPLVSLLARLHVPRIFGIVLTLTGFVVFALFFLGNKPKSTWPTKAFRSILIPLLTPSIPRPWLVC